jgi:hypothetical protein
VVHRCSSQARHTSGTPQAPPRGSVCGVLSMYVVFRTSARPQGWLLSRRCSSRSYESYARTDRRDNGLVSGPACAGWAGPPCGFRNDGHRTRGVSELSGSCVSSHPYCPLPSPGSGRGAQCRQNLLSAAWTALPTPLSRFAYSSRNSLAIAHPSQRPALRPLRHVLAAESAPRLELGAAPPPPDHRHPAMADRGGRDRVLPDREGDGLPDDRNRSPLCTSPTPKSASCASMPKIQRTPDVKD